MKVKVKEFVSTTCSPVDEKINEFLSFSKRELVDVKYVSCKNTYSTQGYALALLIYKEGDSND